MKKPLQNFITLFLVFSLPLLVNAQSSLSELANGLRITEIMYHPPDELPGLGDQLEFLELKNISNVTLDLTGVKILGGIGYIFPNGTEIEPQGFAVIVSDSTAFKNKYPGVSFTGQYIKVLGNGGDSLHVSNKDNLPILILEYDDEVPWPFLSDGNGYSSVPTDMNPPFDQEDGELWRASANPGGSPGEDDPTPPDFPAIFVNEILTHTDLPEKDAIELYNASDNEVDISGWFLSDDRNNPEKFKIPANTTIPANGYVVFTEDDFNVGVTAFSFNRIGEEVLLFSADTGENLLWYTHGWQFKAQVNGTSFGIYTNSIGDKHFVAQSETTLGAENAYPKIGPVVIERIMYNPILSEDEYLMLTNITENDVPLYDPNYPENTWHVDGIRFYFPQNVTLKAKSSLILTQIDSGIFRSKYNVPNSFQIYTYPGRVSNGGEEIELMFPDRPDTVLLDSIIVPYVVMDAVEYDDEAPWPLTPDGDGPYLQRKTVSEYGNDPANWRSSDDDTVGIDELTVENDINIYPNPASSELNIIFKQQPELLQILDAAGRLLFYETSFNTDRKKVDLQAFDRGLYFVKITFKDYAVIRKFIISE